MKKVPTFEEFVNESKLVQTYEGSMSDLLILAQEAKDFKDFVKTTLKEYPQLKKEKDLDAWLESIYNTAVNEESDLPGSVHAALGPKQARVVISGVNTEKFQSEIVNAVLSVDKSAKLNFFAKTNKIVGVITSVRLKDIKKVLTAIDKSLEAEIKDAPTLKKL